MAGVGAVDFREVLARADDQLGTAARLAAELRYVGGEGVELVNELRRELDVDLADRLSGGTRHDSGLACTDNHVKPFLGRVYDALDATRETRVTPDFYGVTAWRHSVLTAGL